MHIKDGSKWIDFHSSSSLSFDASPGFYRIKPEPKLRPFTFEEWKNILRQGPVQVESKIGNVFTITGLVQETN